MAFVLHKVALIEPQRILVLLVSRHLRAARSPRVHFARGARVLAFKRLLHHHCIDTPCMMPLLVDAPWFVPLNLSHFIDGRISDLCVFMIGFRGSFFTNPFGNKSSQWCEWNFNHEWIVEQKK